MGQGQGAVLWSLLSSLLGLLYFSLFEFLHGFPLLTFLIFLLLLPGPSHDQLESYFSDALLLPCELKVNKNKFKFKKTGKKEQ